MTTVESRPTTTPVLSERPNAPTKLIVAMALAMLGAYLTILTPVIVTMSIRVAQIAPDDKSAALGTVLSVGAVLALIGNPFFGAMSDRTTSRFGRRRPWLLGGMLLGSIGLLIVALGDNIPTLTAGWALAQLGINATLATLTALLPDQIPPQQRGKVSGILGLMTSVAILAGSALAAALANTVLMFMVPAAIGVATIGLLVVVLKDRPAEKGHFAPYGFKEFLGTFYIHPGRYPDFAWNILSRFLIWTGLACVTTYQAYLLIDRFGYTTDNVAGGILVATLISTVGLIAGSSFGGTLSDRTGQRKPFVLGAGIVIAASLALIAFAGNLTVFLIASALFGLGEGVYLAVDLALATDVLPNPDDAAKDMGVLNIANALPQSLVPILAAPILAVGAGGSNYRLLFLLGAVVAVAGSVLVRMIRGAR
ncbi:MFS transporter [Actinoplanes sp. L3-i22]|uniref:MFS transporter n=1 Tax=Actinoplanes sp. L3-i22 TaxID=2836373 RepID=UPI001C859450|nr:MFS transporter [Actinoplanes sp. L3-i22]